MAGLGSGTNYIPSNVGFASTGNTTTVPLGSSGTFTGTGEQNQLPYVIVSCFADQSGTLFLEFSVDGANWSSEPTAGHNIVAGETNTHSALKSARHFRVKFVNGAAAQATFRLTTYYDTTATPLYAINEVLPLLTSAVPTRPSIAQDEITRGAREGAMQYNKFAFREDIDTTDGDALITADDATNTPSIITTADTFDIAYNNATDGAGSTGATVLQIQYLDGDFNLQTDVHVLGATGSDTTTFSGLGINRVAVVASGTNNANGDNITVTDTGGGGVQAFVPAGLSVTQQLIFHIPINHTGVGKLLMVNGLKLAGGSAPRLVFKVFVFNRLVETRYEVFRLRMDTSIENTIQVLDPTGFPFSGRDVIWVTCSSDTNNAGASARLSLNIYRM